MAIAPGPFVLMQLKHFALQIAGTPAVLTRQG